MKLDGLCLGTDLCGAGIVTPIQVVIENIEKSTGCKVSLPSIGLLLSVACVSPSNTYISFHKTSAWFLSLLSDACKESPWMGCQ